jgi:cold shock CspA family protein
MVDEVGKEVEAKDEVGVVLFVNPRGFGFIEAASGVNYFYHLSQWVDPYNPPVKGKVVKFEVGPAAQPGKRDQAIRVRVVATKPLVSELLSRGAQ